MAVVIMGEALISDVVVDRPEVFNLLYYHGGGSVIIDLGLGDDIVTIDDTPDKFTVITLSGITHVFGKSTASLDYRGTELILVNVEEFNFYGSTIELDPLPSEYDNVFIGFNVDVDENGFSDSTDANDLIDHTGGSGLIEGGLGEDAILFFDSVDNFIITTSAGITRVFGKSTASAPYANQEVVLYSVEEIVFADFSVVISGDGLIQTGSPQYIFDGSADLLLYGTIGPDIIDPMGGDDWIDGGAGVDKVLFYDSIENFTIRTLAGVTHLIGEETAAPSYAGSEVILVNVETLVFSDATLPLAPVTDNLLFGTANSEQIFGTNDDDVIDHLGGSDYIDGSGGIDSVLFFDSIENFTITTLGGLTRILGNASAAEAYRGQEVILVNVEHFLFSEVTVNPGSTVITGTTEGDLLVGTVNDDIIDPMGGSDFIDGGAGDDTLLIDDRLNSFEFWSLLGVTWMWGNNNLATDEYKEFISILQNVEEVQFLDGTVTLATMDNEVIFGTDDEGTEIIAGTAGDDIIDHIAGSDQINGGAGYDTVLFFGNRDDFVVTRLGSRFRVLGKELGGSIDYPYENDEAILDNVERLLFLDGAVTADDNLQQVDIDIIGTSNTGSEFITGTQGNNLIDHLGGSDRINGGAGNDTLLFFDIQTNYTVTTLAGVTRILGKATAETAYRSLETIVTNVEFLRFTDGLMALDASDANVELGLSSGSATTETIIATANDDIIDHLGGRDTIYGGDGVDTVLFFDSRDYYTITVLDGRARVVGSSGAAAPYRGVEVVLDHVENLQFLDAVVPLGGGAGQVENDRFSNQATSQRFDGGDGVDTVIYAGSSSAYSLTRSLGVYTVRRGTVETDTLIDIERVLFTNRSIAIDLDEGDAALNTVRLLGAAFGRAYVNEEAYVGAGLNLFDNGWDMNDVANLIVGMDGFRNLSNQAFVQTLCSNIGFAATPTDISFFTQVLDLGVERGDLLRAAAEYYTNDLSINLAGLRQTGVEFVDWG